MGTKDLCIRRVGVWVLEEELICPFRIASGEHERLRNVVLCIELGDGTKGYGEAAIATHITGETVEGTEKNLREVGGDLIGQEAGDYLRVSAGLSERLRGNRAGLAAVEMAMMDAVGRAVKVPLWRFFGARPSRVGTDITIVIGDAGETEAAVKRFYGAGFRTFKVKLAGEADADYGRLAIVKKFAPKGKICLDANQSYSADEAVKFLRVLRRFDIAPLMIEQPVDKGDWEGLKKVRRLGRVAVCADESVTSLSDAVRVIREKAADIVNIKLMKFGVLEAMEAARLVRGAGLGLMMGSMMEGNLAATAGAHAASGLGGFEYVDLDTPFFIKGQLRENPYLSSRGVYDVRSVKAGIGIIPRLGQRRWDCRG